MYLEDGWEEKEGMGRAQIGRFVLGLLAVEVVLLGLESEVGASPCCFWRPEWSR